MSNDQENRQQERQGNQNPGQQGGQPNRNPDDRSGSTQDQSRTPGQQNIDADRKRREEEERKRKMGGGDQGKVGQDTDGDGRVVKPGQTPGQSGGTGLPDSR